MPQGDQPVESVTFQRNRKSYKINLSVEKLLPISHESNTIFYGNIIFLWGKQVKEDVKSIQHIK